MTIDAVKQRPSWADLDAVAALRAIQPAAVRSYHGINAAVSCLDGVFAHPFVANTRAAFAENASLRIVRYDRRKIFLGLGVFLFCKSLFHITPVKDHFLE